MSQGKSNGATLKKEVGLSTCLGFRLPKIKATKPYFVFDLNAGTGMNRLDNATVKGTPLVVYDKLNRANRSGYIWAIEKNRNHYKKLQQRLNGQQGLLFDELPNITTECLRMDNRKFLPTVAERIKVVGIAPGSAEGIIIADPNGLDVPVKEIRQVLRDCPRLDVWIHLGAVNAVMADRRRNPKKPGDPFCPNPNNPRSIETIDDLFTIPKQDWLISERFGNGRGHWLMFGSNEYLTRYVHPCGLCLHRLDSAEGQAIIAGLRGSNGNGIS